MHHFNLIAVSLKGNGVCGHSVHISHKVYTVYCVKCANYIVICHLVSVRNFSPSQTDYVNGIEIFVEGRGRQGTTSVCCIMGALWFVPGPDGPSRLVVPHSKLLQKQMTPAVIQRRGLSPGQTKGERLYPIRWNGRVRNDAVFPPGGDIVGSIHRVIAVQCSGE